MQCADLYMLALVTGRYDEYTWWVHGVWKFATNNITWILAVDVCNSAKPHTQQSSWLRRIT